MLSVAGVTQLPGMSTKHALYLSSMPTNKHALYCRCHSSMSMIIFSYFCEVLVPVERRQGRGVFLGYGRPRPLHRPTERTRVLRPLHVLELRLDSERRTIGGAV